MACAALGTAVSRLCQFAVRTDAGLGVQAPEEAVVACRLRSVGFGENELALPAQRRTQIRGVEVEAVRFPNHAATPDAAFKMARVTATLASCTL